MLRYEYKVVPAPQKGTKAKGVKTSEGRFAVSIEQLLNKLGSEGWEYQRAELLPSEERSGLTSSTVNWRNVLVFRRALPQAAAPAAAAETAPEAPVQADDGIAMARPVPGPEELEVETREPVIAPAPISQESQDPPLTLKTPDAQTEDDAEPEETRR